MGARHGLRRRNTAEWAFSRLKRLPGGALRSRSLQAQRVEAAIGARALNRMAEFGMTHAERVA